MVTTKLNLSMTEPSVRQIYAKQGDTGRVLDITLDQTPEDGTLRILRPDGTEVTSEAVTGGEVESGSSFESLTEADVTELTVGIEPVQDLNGYDKPWVGGAGKNLLPVTMTSGTTSSGIVQNVDSLGVITLTGTVGSSVYLGVVDTITLPSGTYVINGIASNNYSATLQVRNGSASGGTIATDSGSGALVSLGSETTLAVVIRIPGGATIPNSLVVKPMLRLSTETDPTFAPYSNICPITGHDEVTVTRTGINVWDEEWEVGSISGTGSNQNANDRIRSKNYISVVPNATYFYHINSTYGIFTWGYDANKNYVGRVPSNAHAISNNTVTIPTNVCYIRFVVQSGYGTTYNNDISINYPSTDHDYHAYQGSTYTTSLGQTVYGGTLDLVSGVLTVDRAMVDLGSLSWIKEGVPDGYRFYAPLSGAQVADAEHKTAICTQYALLVAGQTYARQQGFTIVSNGNIYIYDETQESATASGFKTAMNGVTCVYSLTEPVTYQLTAQQIKTLVGTNNVWASSGDIVNITFTYGGLLSELPSEATEVVGKCYCDIEQNGVSSMPFTLNVKKNERES